MAYIDAETQELVLRVAYDGAARAGKTTNLQQLQAQIGGTVFTPQSVGDRTLYFDWLTHTGGNFDGAPIRTELISVPGQEILESRRDLLLSTADVVVHVFDLSTASLEQLDRAIARLEELAGERTFPLGLVFQANKCDLEPAIDLEEIRDFCMTRSTPIPLTTAVASEGQGVRQTFAYAIRQGLDRARAQATGEAFDEPGAPSDGPQLLEWLETHEAADEAPTSTPAPHKPTSGQPAPALPSPTVPSGMIWPALGGRAILEDLSSRETQLEEVSPDAWMVHTGGRWKMFSGSDCVFDTLDVAVNKLREWGRAHSAIGTMLSRPRCIVLAPETKVMEASSRRWRLWQIVRNQRSLHEGLALSLGESDPQTLACHVLRAATDLVTLERRRKKFPQLPICTLKRVSDHELEPQYIGLVPGPGVRVDDVGAGREEQELVVHEFQPLFRDWGDAMSGVAVAMKELAAETADAEKKSMAVTLMSMMRDLAVAA